MLGQLLVIAGPDQGRVFPLQEGKSLSVGRGQNTETRLKDPQLSRVHCQVTIEGRKIVLLDSGSTSGTLVNGKRVSQQELKPGDVIQIGGTQLHLDLKQPRGQHGRRRKPHAQTNGRESGAAWRARRPKPLPLPH